MKIVMKKFMMVVMMGLFGQGLLADNRLRSAVEQVQNLETIVTHNTDFSKWNCGNKGSRECPERLVDDFEDIFPAYFSRVWEFYTGDRFAAGVNCSNAIYGNYFSSSRSGKKRSYANAKELDQALNKSYGKKLGAGFFFHLNQCLTPDVLENLKDESGLGEEKIKALLVSNFYNRNLKLQKASEQTLKGIAGLDFILGEDKLGHVDCEDSAFPGNAQLCQSIKNKCAQKNKSKIDEISGMTQEAVYTLMGLERKRHYLAGGRGRAHYTKEAHDEILGKINLVYELHPWLKTSLFKDRIEEASSEVRSGAISRLSPEQFSTWANEKTNTDFEIKKTKKEIKDYFTDAKKYSLKKLKNLKRASWCTKAEKDYCDDNDGDYADPDDKEAFDFDSVLRSTPEINYLEEYSKNKDEYLRPGKDKKVAYQKLDQMEFLQDASCIDTQEKLSDEMDSFLLEQAIMGAVTVLSGPVGRGLAHLGKTALAGRHTGKFIFGGLVLTEGPFLAMDFNQSIKDCTNGFSNPQAESKYENHLCPIEEKSTYAFENDYNPTSCLMSKLMVGVSLLPFIPMDISAIRGLMSKGKKETLDTEGLTHEEKVAKLKLTIKNSDRRKNGQREKNNDRRTSDPNQREKVDDIQAELGSKKIDELIDRYNPEKRSFSLIPPFFTKSKKKISFEDNRERVYYAGLANLFEKKFLKEIKENDLWKSNDAALREAREKTQEELSKIIGLCGEDRGKKK
jgi:hypothetical protein